MATSPPRIVVCGAGVIGAAVAHHLARRGARPLLVDRARPGAAASGKGSGLLALDWRHPGPGRRRRAGARRARRRGQRRLDRRRGAAGRRDRAGPRPLDEPGAAVARPFPSLVRADAPAQAAFSEFVDREGRRGEYRLYPRPDGTVDVTGDREHAPLPDDPEAIAPADAAVDELRRVAGVHASRPRGAAPAGRSACDRPLTVDGLPLIGPVPGAPGA